MKLSLQCDTTTQQLPLGEENRSSSGNPSVQLHIDVSASILLPITFLPDHKSTAHMSITGRHESLMNFLPTLSVRCGPQSTTDVFPLLLQNKLVASIIAHKSDRRKKSCRLKKKSLPMAIMLRREGRNSGKLGTVNPSNQSRKI